MDDCLVEWVSASWGWWCLACNSWINDADAGTSAELAMSHMRERHGLVVYCGIIDNQPGAYLRARPKVGAR